MQSLDVSQRSVWWLKHGQPCLHQLHMLTGHSLPLVYGMCIYPHSTPSFTIPLINQCDRCLVPLLGGSWLEGEGLPAMEASLGLAAGFVKSGSPWTSWAPTSWDTVVNFSVTDTPLIQDIVALTFITDTGPHAVSCFTWPFSTHKETVSLGLEKPL